MQRFLPEFAEKQAQKEEIELLKGQMAAATHFKEEERLMIASKFDGYKMHKASHESFTEKCKTTYANFERLPVSKAIKFALFLYNWIHNHIAYEDRLYLPTLVEFLKNNQSR